MRIILTVRKGYYIKKLNINYLRSLSSNRLNLVNINLQTVFNKIIIRLNQVLGGVQT
jgi:hypothetical protein